MDPPASASPAAAHLGETIRLRRRRIYILPTRHGLLYGLTLVIMLVGSINYNNSLGHALTFLLTGVGLAAMVQTHRNLSGLRLSGGRAAAVFAGDTASFPVRLEADGPDRIAIAVRSPDGPPDIGDVRAGDGHDNRLAVRRAAAARGRLRAGAVRVSTEYPLALFRAWSWVELDSDCLVYPRPEAGVVPPPGGATHEGGRWRDPVAGADDFQGLRGYQPGDSPRHIAWKRLPVSQEPSTKQFEGNASPEVWLEWGQLPAMDTEQRLARLCRWVLDSDARGLRYGLRIPGTQLAPNAGALHRRRCLEALALLPPPGGRSP